MPSLKTALVANAGTTAAPIIKALEATAAEGAVTLFLAYGRAISDQETTPFSIANTLSERAKELGANCRICELDTPEDFAGSFQFYQNLIGEVNRYQPDRVIVDITGGTKVMAAAVTYAAVMQQWGAEVIFEYIGGPRDANGRVKEMVLKRDPGIVTQERIVAVLNGIREGEFAHAAFLALSLPRHGKTDFLRKATDIFWMWDNFHYEGADHSLGEIVTQAKVLVDDKQFGKITGTVIRLQRVSGKIKMALNTLGQIKKDGGTSFSPIALEGWIAILGDTVANARRRVNTDPTDCVLRGYRAIEVATQIVVVKLGINLWKPDWKKIEKQKMADYLSKIRSSEPPRQISLDLGIKLIETLVSPLPDEVIQAVGAIMSARNFSYLEHGYDKVSEHTAQSLVVKMEKVIIALLSKANIKDDPLAIAEQVRIDA